MAGQQGGRGRSILAAAAAIVIAGGAGYGYWVSTQGDRYGLPLNDGEDPARGAARLACRDRIATRLHDPGSVEWGDLADWLATAPQGGVITVYPEYRARNRLGALVLTEQVCEVRVGSGAARVIALRDYP